MDTPDIKDIPPHPQRAWEYGYNCATKEYVAVIASLQNRLATMSKKIDFLHARLEEEP